MFAPFVVSEDDRRLTCVVRHALVNPSSVASSLYRATYPLETRTLRTVDQEDRVRSSRKKRSVPSSRPSRLALRPLESETSVHTMDCIRRRREKGRSFRAQRQLIRKRTGQMALPAFFPSETSGAPPASVMLPVATSLVPLQSRRTPRSHKAIVSSCRRSSEGEGSPCRFSELTHVEHSSTQRSRGAVPVDVQKWRSSRRSSLTTAKCA